VVSPVQKKYLKKAAAHDAEKLKDAKYGDACEAAGVDFVLETFGGCVQSLATLMSHKTANNRADCIEHIWQRLSVARKRQMLPSKGTFDHESDWIS
jgi:hypothetical protein